MTIPFGLLDFPEPVRPDATATRSPFQRMPAIPTIGAADPDRSTDAALDAYNRRQRSIGALEAGVTMGLLSY